jgi:two-component system, cell cycle sensor histidine kinase and response regulator CckA
MTHSYDVFFVVLSVIVAMLASFAALDFAGRVRSDAGVMRRGWILIGATVMGLGIWSMHFVGMIAFQLPVPVWYDPTLMVLSMLVAIAASLLALVVINRPTLGLGTFLPAGVLMGGAIAGMHYIGMASMRTDAALTYHATIVALSIAIAVGASLAALWLAFRFRSDRSRRGVLLKMGSAIIMGIAIAGMHYTGMSALRFAAGAPVRHGGAQLLATGELGGAVALSAILILVLALIGAVIDRNLQSRAAFTEQLRQSEQRTRLIVDTSLDAVIAMDARGCISDWNQQAEKMFGWSRVEAIGRRMVDTIIPVEYRERHDRGLARFLENGEGPVLNRRIEVVGLNRQGDEFPIELAISPAKLGKEWTFSAFIRDLTEQKKAAEAVRLGELRYRELFENVPIGLYRSMPDGRLVDANPAMVEMFGYANRESLLATPAPTLYDDPADRLRWSAEMTRTGSVIDFDVRLRRADGTVIWARDTTHAKRDADGNVLLYEGVITDITDRVLLEAQLRQALKMEAVGQLAGGVAHDFNNLLTVIMSYGSLLLDRLEPDDPNREDVQEIAGAADRAARLTRQLLAFSRKQVMQPQVLDINVVIHDLEKMLRRLIGENIEFVTELRATNATIVVDPGNLEQVLMNLVVNARDAMPQGGRLTISTNNATESGSATPGSRDARSVVLEVSDTGMGMTEDTQRRVFDPFFTTKEQGRGTGLGLSTVYGIVKQSSGEIRVRSRLDHGTTFSVFFPKLASPEPGESAVPAAEEMPRGAESVLLVEDDANLRTLATRVLQRCGYTVLVAAGGAEALAIAADQRTRLDLVVSDVVMPDMNGREVVERLLDYRPGIAYLLMSGYTDDDVILEGTLHGEMPFLQKPFTPAQLAQKVRHVLEHNGQRGRDLSRSVSVSR